MRLTTSRTRLQARSRSHLRVHSQAGIGLIEILIALVVVSIGFLAAARMQVQGMRFSQSAYYNSQAYFMASDMIDRMRANVEGVSDGDYDGGFATRADILDPGCASKTCTPAELARQDLFDWSVPLHPALAGIDTPAALPGDALAPARAEVLGNGDGYYTINVHWTEVLDSRLNHQTLSLSFISELRQ